MDLKRLLGLRPKETTAAALAETREKIEREERELGERIAEIQRTRGARLLDGEPTAVERAEVELKTAEEERARLLAMLDVLRQREAEAKRREEVAEVERLREDADRKLESFLAWWRSEYPRHAEAIVRGMQLEREVLAAQGRMEAQAARCNVLLERSPATPKNAALPGLSLSFHTIGELVALPPLEAPEGRSSPNIWPPHPRQVSI